MITWELLDWCVPATQAVLVRRAVGMCVIWWPSGRRTIEELSAYGTIRATRPTDNNRLLRLTTDRNIGDMMESLKHESHPAPGWFIRLPGPRRIRPRARKVTAVAFFPESSYNGPPPDRWGRI